jgi:hypothetical protein
MSRDAEQFEPDPVIEAYKRDVDRTLIRENLRLTVEERFDALMRLQKFAEELRRAGREATSLEEQREGDRGKTEVMGDEETRCAECHAKLKADR